VRELALESLVAGVGPRDADARPLAELRGPFREVRRASAEGGSSLSDAEILRRQTPVGVVEVPTDSRPKEASVSTLTIEETELAESASRFWWLYLLTGILWLWVTLIILRLNLDSVYAIAILFGFVAIGAGINEFLAMGASTTGWKIAHGVLGVVFVAAGIVAFFRPQGTFVALASIVAWVLLFKGIFDIVLALVTHPAHLWWVGLVVGIIEILLAFWAAGYFRGSAIIIVAWVAALTLMRGITEIVMAFRLRQLKKELS
jgi:uncharacterized membrane protein HdeD (DUF308 family)